MWATKFFLRKIDDERKQKMLAICKELTEKDATFKVRIEEDYLIINSEDKNQAHKRGVWLINNSEPFKGLGYNVYWEN